MMIFCHLAAHRATATILGINPSPVTLNQAHQKIMSQTQCRQSHHEKLNTISVHPHPPGKQLRALFAHEREDVSGTDLPFAANMFKSGCCEHMRGPIAVLKGPNLFTHSCSKRANFGASLNSPARAPSCTYELAKRRHSHIVQNPFSKAPI